MDKARCPGCHFECKLDQYQCGRGKIFYKKAQAGEKLPERRIPFGHSGKREDRNAGATPLPPINFRVMHVLTILSRMLADQEEQSDQRKIVGALEHGNGFMSLPILRERARLDRDQLIAALDSCEDTGLVVVEDEEHAGTVARITETGKEQGSIWKEERNRQIGEFLSPLTNEEKEQLEQLIRKLFRPPAQKRH